MPIHSFFPDVSPVRFKALFALTHLCMACNDQCPEALTTTTAGIPLETTPAEAGLNCATCNALNYGITIHGTSQLGCLCGGSVASSLICNLCGCCPSVGLPAHSKNLSYSCSLSALQNNNIARGARGRPTAGVKQ